MKKITLRLMFLSLLLVTILGYSQKVAVIGMNHVTPDGFTFLVTQDLAANEVIYFTENEYNDAANAFNDQGESVVAFTASASISKGTVVFVNETSTDTFSVSCSSGVCGTAVKTGTSGNFALATDGETMYAYSDSDANPTNGITTIHSVLYSGDTDPAVVNGGMIPVAQNPSFDYPTAIVIDGFPAVQPSRVEFNPTTLARTDVTKVGLENPSNYVHAQSNAALSTLSFTNFNLTGSNPILSLAASPAMVNENSGTGMVYTFTLSAAATSNITVNFSVGGTAAFNTDYTQTGAASFSTTTGTVTILNGASTASITLTSVSDTTLEANETIALTVLAGTGYTAGSSSAATTTILNDDTLTITPIVAVAGINHGASDAFSFVALQDISAGTVIYFTENPFDKSTLTFSGAEGVMQWTAPAGGLARGQVVVATETSTNTFTTTCSSGTCGNVSIVSGTFSLATTGEELYAYLDADSDHTNGVTSVQAVLYTGTSATSGGTIPTNQDPETVYVGAVVVDGFPSASPIRTEYNPAVRNVTVDRANFQNPSNWLNGQSDITLSATQFSNIIISTGVANPFASVTVSPSSVLENSGTPMVYTFALTSPATTNTTINFSVSGTATFTTDYTVSGSTSFTSTTGSVVILSGASSAIVNVTPVGDTALEVQESVVLTVLSGTGYDGGNPNSATGLINNDDTTDSDPLVAIVGLSHTDPDGFSFVAAQDIPANTVIYFTDNSFDKSTLLFGTGDAVISWTSPATVTTKGKVIVVTETAPDSFSVSCSTGACGSVALVSGNFAIATSGETLYAYKDNDTNPSNGVTDIYAVLYTGTSSVSGGNIPSIEDPSAIFLKALVVDGFPVSAPARTEYDATKRGVQISTANFENISNWVNSQSPAALSTVAFSNLNIVDNVPPTAICKNISVTPDAATGSVKITAADVNNGSTDNVGILSYAIDIDTFTCANVGTPVAVTLTVTDTSGNTNSCTATVTVNSNVKIEAAANQSICAGESATLTAACNSMTVSTTLSGTKEVPANASTATGTVTGNFDKITNLLTLNISFNGLTGGNASAAHIHKAAVGVNGGVVIGFTGVPSATSGSFTYSGTLTTVQAADLLAGLYYVNIHNTTFPGGEIRGQLSTMCSADTFVWNNGGGSGQTVTVSPTTTTTYTLTASNSVTGCSSTSQTTVTVNQKPMVDAGANQSICNGASATLTAACNSMTVSTTLSGTNEVPTNASTATGTVTGNFDKITNLLTLNISFNGLTGGNASAAHIHKAAVGVNGGVVIGFTGVPTATSGSFTYSGTLTSVQAADLLAGLYYVNIHNTTFPGGEIRGQLSTICSADTFVWNNGGGSGQTVTVSPTTTTTYTLTASNSVTGCSSTSQTTVTVEPIVNSEITLNSETLTATQSGATYQWYQCPNTLIIGAVNQSYSPTTIGDYKAEITMNGCTVTSSCVTVATLGTETFNDLTKTLVYPNPTKGILKIKSGVEDSYTVVNYLGQIVKKFNVNVGINTINIENLVDGVYFIMNASGKNQVIEKIIKN